MALPTSRKTLKEWCLRALGAPVITINVDNQQLEDRLDEAISFFQEFHFDGVEKVLLKHKVTASVFTVSATPGAFVTGEVLTGGTSGATGIYKDKVDADKTIRFTTTTGTFVAGEVITGGSSGVTATVVSIVLGDYDNKYIPLSESVISVANILNVGTIGRGNIFDVQYQFMLNNIPNYTSMDVISYEMVMQHFQLLNDLFSSRRPYRFNRREDRIYIDFDWSINAPIDYYLLIEAYRPLNPETFTKMYSDEFLIRYTTACFKRQWGTNLKKYDGVVLVGGVKLNGKEIHDEAVKEITDMKAEILSKYQEPCSILIG